MFDGLIFDVDGTLWDSTPIVCKAWTEAFKSLGFEGMEVTAERLRGLFGLPMDEIIKDFLPDSTAEEREKYGQVCCRYEHEYLERDAGICYPKLNETLRELSKEHKIFIVSNCQGGYVELFLEKTGLGDIVEGHLCPADTGLLKADNIRKIVEDYGLKEPVYIGDTVMDEQACQKAGVPFIYAAYGFGKAQNPDYTINTPGDLLELCQSTQASQEKIPWYKDGRKSIQIIVAAVALYWIIQGIIGLLE